LICRRKSRRHVTGADFVSPQTNIPHLPRLGTATTDNMSLSNCRFYEEKYPEIDSFVMVNVKQVSIPTRQWGVLQ
jgi:hypothetical protein